jgi:hypothetical protein
MFRIDDVRHWATEVRHETQERAHWARERGRRVIEDLPYAALGTVVVAVEKGREALTRAAELPERAVHATREAPRVAGEAFDHSARRGRRVVSRVRSRDSVRDAADQAHSARSKLQGAATSVSRAARRAVDATEDSVSAVLDPQDTRAYEERSCDELRKLASTRRIEGRSAMRKVELIDALRKAR